MILQPDDIVVGDLVTVHSIKPQLVWEQTLPYEVKRHKCYSYSAEIKNADVLMVTGVMLPFITVKNFLPNNQNVMGGYAKLDTRLFNLMRCTREFVEGMGLDYDQILGKRASPTIKTDVSNCKTFTGIISMNQENKE